MSRRLRPTAAAAVALAGVIAVSNYVAHSPGKPVDWDILSRLAHPFQGPGSRQMRALRAEAESACKCARQSGDEKGRKACWQAFETRAARFEHGSQPSLCDPINPDILCFGDNPLDCITIGYDVMNEHDLLCTREEAQTAEAVYRDAERRHAKDPTGEEPLIILRRTAHAIVRGEKVARPAEEPQCTG